MSRGFRRLLFAILGISFLLRLALVSSGGSEYWPDEGRYARAGLAVTAAAAGNWDDVRGALLGHADHPLFTWVASPPALLEKLAGRQPFAVGAYFASLSTLVILLVWLVAKAAGAGDGEALLAALFAAGANSLFYFSRHLFPYDAALCLMLGALAVGLRGRTSPRGIRAGMLSGALAGAGFLVYNGYWLLALAVMGLPALAALPGWRRAGGSLMFTALGFALAVGGFALLARVGGFDLLADARRSAGTITQGDFGGGLSIIGGYLWATERGALALWIPGALAALVAFRTAPRRGAWWLAGAGFVLAGLYLFSDVVPRFVVYGRLVRQAVPFLCLASACGYAAIAAREGRAARLAPVLAALVVICAALNFSGPLRMVFPPGFLQQARDEIARQEPPRSRFRIIRAEHLWGSGIGGQLPAHSVVLRAPHPLEYVPYQFEGFSLEQRRKLQAHDISMQVIRLEGSPLWPAGPPRAGYGDFPGPVVFRLRFPPGGIGRTEPLVVTGVPGRGDFVWVRYQDAARVQFGLDHWGIGGLESPLVEIDYRSEHEVIVDLGTLHPEGTPRRRTLRIVVDGKPVLEAETAFHPATADEITFGANFIGGTTTESRFTGTVVALERRVDVR